MKKLPENQKELTIILTLKGRPNFTLRWMQYMQSIHCEAKILVADGGDDKELENHLLNKCSFPLLNYDYIRCPYDESFAVFYKKIVDVTNLVTTKYVMYADNDDFFFVDAINQCIAFLEKNDDFCSCGGDSASLTLYSDDNKIINSPSGKNHVIRFDKTDVMSINLESAVGRACAFLSNSHLDKIWFNYYDVHRTNHVNISNDYKNVCTIKDPVSFEVYRAMSLLLLGKHKKIDLIYYIRQNGSSELAAVLDQGPSVAERFIILNCFDEIITGLKYIDSSLSNEDVNLIKRHIFIWVRDRIRYSYFSSNSYVLEKMRKTVRRINNFWLSNFLHRTFFFIRNFFSRRKVFFLKIDAIEKSITKKYELL